MLYNESRMALTKERLEDLRKEKKLSFEQLSKQLAERGVSISHTNLKNYEINDPLHPLYGRTRSMSIEYLVAFADFYDVSVEYLLGLSNSRKREYRISPRFPVVALWNAPQGLLRFLRTQNIRLKRPRGNTVQCLLRLFGCENCHFLFLQQ